MVAAVRAATLAPVVVGGQITRYALQRLVRVVVGVGLIMRAAVVVGVLGYWVRAKVVNTGVLPQTWKALAALVELTEAQPSLMARTLGNTAEGQVANPATLEQKAQSASSGPETSVYSHPQEQLTNKDTSWNTHNLMRL